MEISSQYRIDTVVSVTGTNITCALGIDTEQTFNAMIKGQSGLAQHDHTLIGVNEDYIASTVNISQLCTLNHPATRVEHMAIHSVTDALSQCNVNPADKHTLFILSTTKGNIGLLTDNKQNIPAERIYLPEFARFISKSFGNSNKPIVVSNACISGLSALILAKRFLDSKLYDNIVVCGVDEITKFTVSGFQSFKALSSEPCRPFDETRNGLNLGECAATIILTRLESTNNHPQWNVYAGAIHNDANHISGPSRVGEGSFRCLNAICNQINIDKLAFINAHGTATMYNDEMESIAIERAGLLHIPVNALKGYLGHTLGAAGILECILSMVSFDNGVILPTIGYQKLGVSRNVNIVRHLTTIPSGVNSFIKMMSGFGGSNAAILMRKEGIA